MQFIVTINQSKALAWGLNAQQAMLFAFLHQVPTWANTRQIDGHTFYNVSKGKVVEELPLLTDKPDTAYRLMKQLRDAGLIEMTSCDNRTYMRLTPKAKAWNRTGPEKGSEKYPTLGGKEPGSEKNPTSENSPSRVGKKSEPGSEKSPTNQDTKNQVTKDQTPLSDAGESSRRDDVFTRAAQQCDDGTPPPATARRFSMTLDWQPDPEQLAMACLRAGLPADLVPETHQLAKFTAHHADHPERMHGAMAWTTRLVDWLRNDQRRAPAPTGGPDDANHRAADPVRDERRRIREALADPYDTSWADGWCQPSGAAADDPARGAGAGGAGVHASGSAVPEDLGERVSDLGGDVAEPQGAGAGVGDLAGAADTAGGGAGNVRPEAVGEYLAADDPGADRGAGAHSRGFRHAGYR